MPVVTVAPAPARLIDHLIEMGGIADDHAARGRGQGRRGADKADAQRDQRSDEDCTHFNSPWFLAKTINAMGPNLSAAFGTARG